MTIRVKFWGTRGSIPRPESSDEAIHARLRAVLNAAGPEDIVTPAAVDAFINGGCRGALPTDLWRQHRLCSDQRGRTAQAC